MTTQDQCREAFEHDQRVAATRALSDGLQRQGIYMAWPTVTGLVDIVSAARSAPAAPVELPEPAAWLIERSAFRVSPHGQDAESNEWLEEAHEPGEEGSFRVYTEQQVRELLSQAGTVLPETPESPPKSAETRMDASSDRGGGVLPAGWVAVPVEPTEDMHVAACKVLQRANGLDGTPKRMLDAMLAAAPKLPQVDGCWCQTCRPITLDDMRMVLCPDCGNKRCPRATHHDNACTGSNEPGQPGSSWRREQQPQEQSTKGER